MAPVHYTFDDPNWKLLDKDKKKLIEDYGDELKATYLKNGLCSEEVKLRQASDGPNKLPEKKKTPAIIKILLEVSNVFSLLLELGAVLAFIGYALTPDDQSNVKHILKSQ